jgi:hypothetical protein
LWWIQRCACCGDKVRGRACFTAFARARFSATQNDVAVANAFKGVKVDAAKFANVARYLAHINSFSAAAQAKYVGSRLALARTRACLPSLLFIHLNTIV